MQSVYITTDAPTAAEYDELRALAPEVLRQRFKNFETKFLPLTT
jgi:hypothetical protein